MWSFSFKTDSMTGEAYYEVYARGRQVLNDPHLNKGAGFTPGEREAMGCLLDDGPLERIIAQAQWQPHFTSFRAG